MARRNKKGSLKYQMKQELAGMKALGESKHEAKKAQKASCEATGQKWNPTQVPGKIFAKKSFRTYQQQGGQFISWIKEQEPGHKDLKQISRELGIRYLQEKQAQGCTPATVSTTMASLNKVFGWGLSKKEAGLKSRSYKQITRSRGIKAHDGKYNHENWKGQMLVAQAFGCRRESISPKRDKTGKLEHEFVLKPSSFVRHEGKTYALLVEKGGKYRAAPCLAKHEKAVGELLGDIKEVEKLPTMADFKQLHRSCGEPFLFKSYTAKVDNHALRSQYACDRYTELTESKVSSGKVVENDYREKYDAELVARVSQDLGHNRLAIVVENYFRD